MRDDSGLEAEQRNVITNKMMNLRCYLTHLRVNIYMFENILDNESYCLYQQIQQSRRALKFRTGNAIFVFP
jgi:hypothetical protein